MYKQLLRKTRLTWLCGEQKNIALSIGQVNRVRICTWYPTAIIIPICSLWRPKCQNFYIYTWVQKTRDPPDTWNQNCNVTEQKQYQSWDFGVFTLPFGRPLGMAVHYPILGQFTDVYWIAGPVSHSLGPESMSNFKYSDSHERKWTRSRMWLLFVCIIWRLKNPPMKTREFVWTFGSRFHPMVWSPFSGTQTQPYQVGYQFPSYSHEILMKCWGNQTSLESLPLSSIFLITTSIYRDFPTGHVWWPEAKCLSNPWPIN